jgi:KaiC/GvpD/RAD55 family RecA-like ATPase
MTELAPALDTTAVSDGSNVLVVGPAMTGKRRLMYEVLAADYSDERATGLVTTRKPADVVAMGYRERHPGVHSLAIVDCVSRQQGFSSGQTTRKRQFVSNAGDLTGIGIALTDFMRLFDEDPEIEAASIGFHTLSTLLMYADVRRVFQFLHVLTGRVASSGYLGGFVLDTPVPENALGIIKQVFDGVVEVREVEDTGAREYRVRGLPTAVGPRHWTEF